MRLGIGPEISESVKDIYTAAGVCATKLLNCLMLTVWQVPIQWEEVDVTPILKNGKTAIPDAAIASVKKNTVALKGPLATPSALQQHYPRFRTDAFSPQLARDTFRST